MQYPQGRVVSVHPGGASGQVMVEVDAGVICERCAAGKGCGAGLFGSTAANKLVSATVAADIDLDNGDRVRISLEPRSILQAAIIVYGYPLFGALLGAGSAFGFGLNDAGAAMAALSGTAGGFWVARVKLRNTNCWQKFTPVVLKKISARRGS